MNQYLVTLADRNTGEDQRILVQSPNEDNMQEFVTSDEVLPTLKLAAPVVIGIRQVKVRAPRQTNLQSLVRG